mgnify:CR=1 FL=1
MVLTGIRLMKNTAFFVPADSARNYLKILPQLQVFEHYLNKEYLEQHYKSMTAIGLGDGKVLNPYQDLYVPNILPRINVVIPSRQYNLYYGGVTLLQKQQEFIFENNMTDSISINDFYNLTSGSPYKDISYEYDTTSFSVHPIKTSEKISGDDTRTIIQLRVANMNTNNDIIEKNEKTKRTQSYCKRSKNKKQYIIGRTKSLSMRLFKPIHVHTLDRHPNIVILQKFQCIINRTIRNGLRLTLSVISLHLK